MIERMRVTAVSRLALLTGRALRDIVRRPGLVIMPAAVARPLP